MTERPGYQPDQTPQGAMQDRLVFTPDEHPHLEFDIRQAAIEQGKSIGADGPEIYQALEDAQNAADQARNEAAARTPEGGLEEDRLRSDMTAHTVWLVRVGRGGVLNPETVDPSLN